MKLKNKQEAAKVFPRLIKPEKDGESGGWSYLFNNEGTEYIFPAEVSELGVKNVTPQDIVQKSAELTKEEVSYIRKVIYWRASEWETKLLPKAIEWVNKNGFVFPQIPFHVMELRKIEDRDGEDRVTECMEFFALEEHVQQDGTNKKPCILVEQYKEVPGEVGPHKKPLMQLWSDGYIEFSNKETLKDCLFSVTNACESIPDWGKHPEFLKSIIEDKGAGDAFKMMCLRKRKKEYLAEETLRLATIWLAMTCYISSLKTTYEAGLPSRGPRRKEEKVLDEAVALEQAEIFTKVGVLKSGVRKKPVATGTGTQHGYRYLVRGHERIINGKAIWIKPQIRGQGEFIDKAIGTEEAVNPAQKIAKIIVDVGEESVKTKAATATKSKTGIARLFERFFSFFKRP